MAKFHSIGSKFNVFLVEVHFHGKLSQYPNIISRQMKYTLLKNGNRITSGTIELCSEIEKSSKGFAAVLLSFGLPDKCPVEKVRLLNLTQFLEARHVP